jgi:antitoxin component of RelBE/YafQ-DinJ toxin-antitoxin module
MKNVLLNLKISEEVRDEFKRVAELRGSTMSGLIHQFIYKTIREEKQQNPDAFTKRELKKKETNSDTLSFEQQAIGKELPKIQNAARSKPKISSLKHEETGKKRKVV